MWHKYDILLNFYFFYCYAVKIGRNWHKKSNKKLWVSDIVKDNTIGARGFWVDARAAPI